MSLEFLILKHKDINRYIYIYRVSFGYCVCRVIQYIRSKAYEHLTVTFIYELFFCDMNT